MFVVNVEPGWLNKVDGLYLVDVSWLPIGQQGSKRQPPVFAAHWRGGIANSTPNKGKMTHLKPSSLSKTPAETQSTYIIGQLFFLGAIYG